MYDIHVIWYKFNILHIFFFNYSIKLKGRIRKSNDLFFSYLIIRK